MNLRRLCAFFLVLLLALPIGSFAEMIGSDTVNVTVEMPTGQVNEYGQPIYAPVDEMRFPYEYSFIEGNLIIKSDALDGEYIRIVISYYDADLQSMRTCVTYNEGMQPPDTISFNSKEQIPLYGWMDVETSEMVTLPMIVTMANRDGGYTNVIEEVVTNENTNENEVTNEYTNENEYEGTNENANEIAGNDSEIVYTSPLVEPAALSVGEPLVAAETIPENRGSNVIRVITDIVYLYSAQGNQTAIISRDEYLTYEATSSDTVWQNENGVNMIPVVLKNGDRGFVEMKSDAITFVDQAEAARYETSLFTSALAVAIKNTDIYDSGYLKTGDVAAGGTVQYLSGADSTLYKNMSLWIKVRSYSDNREGYVLASDLAFKTEDEATAYLESLKQQVDIPTNTDKLKAAGASVTLYNQNLTQTLGTVQAGVEMTFVNSGFVYDANYRAYGQVYIASTMQSGYVKMDETTFYVPETPTEPVPEVTNETSSPPVVDIDSSRMAYMQGARDINIRDTINGTAGRQVDAGDAVKVIQTQIDTSGLTWYYVEVLKSINHPESVGYKGYVRYAAPVDVLRFMTEAEETAFRIAQAEEAAKANTSTPPTSTPTSTATSTPTNTATQAKETTTPTALPAIPQVKGYMRVTAPGYADLNVFQMVGSARLAILSYNEVVYVDGQVYDASGNGVTWCITQPLYDGAPSGYVLASSLVAMTASEVNAYFATPRPTPTSIATYSPTAFSGYAVLIKNRVNFRSTPNGSAMSQLNEGTIVRVVGSTTVDGYTWYECESGGRTGYLRADMLSMLTISQYQQYVTNPSYSQNGNIITPTATVNVGGTTAAVWATVRPGAASTISFVTIPPLSTATPNASGSVDPDASGSLDPNATASDGSLIGDTSASPSLDPDATLPPPPDVDATFDTQESGGFSPPGLLLAVVILLVLAGGGFYGYTVYNKTRKKQAAEQAKRAAGGQSNQRGGNGTGGEKPAVRRPVPPTQANKPTAAAGSATGRPGQGTAPAGTQPGAKPDAQNPYARPQSQQRTQEVSSTMPRAQVDGKPVGDGKTPPANPYARPQSQQAPPKNPAGTQGQGQQRASGTPGQASGTAPRTRMPIAPPPVEPDADARSMQEGAGNTEEAPRRRRRRYTEDGE